MKKFTAGLTAVVAAIALSSCAHLPSNVNLEKARADSGLKYITTGDVTHDPVNAVHYRATEVGIGVGLPYIVKFMELYPKQSNEQQLVALANDAKKDGKTALINVQPPVESYLGFPFFIVGLYVDHTEGTGIVK